jgi:hypothetical protein
MYILNIDKNIRKTSLWCPYNIFLGENIVILSDIKYINSYTFEK